MIRRPATIALVSILAFFLRGSVGAAEPLERRVDALIEGSPLKTGQWGLLVTDAETGEVVFSRNPDQMFCPASVTKLYSTAAFLEQYPATRQKAGCAPTGPCTHRLVLVRVDGRGKPLGDPPSCAEISATLDRDGRGQVGVRGVSWTRRGGPCAA